MRACRAMKVSDLANCSTGVAVILLSPLISMCLGCLGSSGWCCPAGESEGHPVELQVRFLTYNVQFLPGLAGFANKRGDAPYRAKKIAELLPTYDVVCLEEVFDLDRRREVVDTLRANVSSRFEVLLSPLPTDGRFGDGLLLASRYEVLDTHHWRYKRGSSVLKYGVFADGFAAKGAVHAHLKLAPATSRFRPELDVFVTHLEAQDTDVRCSQYRELADFVRQHSVSERPVVLMGDFNTDGRRYGKSGQAAPYREMMKTLNEARPKVPFKDVWLAKGNDDVGTDDPLLTDHGPRIDYLFLSAPEGKGVDLDVRSITLLPLMDDRVKSLSDHCAVEATIVFQPVTP